MQKEYITGKILIIDDEPVNLKALVAFLELHGFSIMVAGSGEEGLAILKENRPDLVLLDIVMPMMDGFEVCQAIKADPASATIPVIFISSLSSVEDKVKAFATGGVDFVTKPFQQQEVLARVSAHLKIASLTSQLESKNRQLLAVLDEVRQLSGILPVCGKCKRARNDKAYWEQVKEFITNHEGAQFFQSFCPDCQGSDELSDLDDIDLDS